MSEWDERSPRLEAALRALAAQDRTAQAPAELEARLLAAFRAEHAPIPKLGELAVRRGFWRFGWQWYGAAALAAGLLVAAVLLPRRSAPPPRTIPQAAAAPPAQSPYQRPAPAPATNATAAKVSTARAKRPANRAVRPVRRPVESVVEEEPFIPLPYAAHLNPGEGLDVVRVKLPRGAMLQYGLPMGAERAWEPVQADLALGQDGIARAIRFVR